MHVIAQTPRFFIRQFLPSDERVYLSLFDDEAVTVHLPNRTGRENQEMFRDSLSEYEKDTPLGRWGIFNNGDDAFIGICLLREFSENKHQVEVGYVLNQQFWGKGVASEMAQIMVTYAFTHTKTKEVVAVTRLENTPSQKVLLKAGLERAENMMRDGNELAFFRLTRKAL